MRIPELGCFRKAYRKKVESAWESLQLLLADLGSRRFLKNETMQEIAFSRKKPLPKSLTTWK